MYNINLHTSRKKNNEIKENGTDKKKKNKCEFSIENEWK